MNTKQKEEKSSFFRAAYGIFAILMVLAITVAGCTSNAPANTQNNNQAVQEITGQNVQETETQNSMPVDSNEPKIDESEIIAADKKSETEKTQDQLASLIADGTYAEDVTYNYHSGSETITVKVVVENDVVQEASVTSVGQANKVSLKYINAVNSALPDLVVGKKINELNLPTQIAGSSLTVAAFKQQIDSLIERY